MAGIGRMIELSDENFAHEVEDAAGVTLVDFWAPWCGPCRLVEPVVQELSEAYHAKGLKVGKLDVNAYPSIQVKHGIRSIPTLLLFRDGRVVDRIVGLMPRERLEARILQHL